VEWAVGRDTIRVRNPETRPLKEVIMTSGGVPLNEVDPATLESRKCPGRYFAGEVLGIDCPTGGHNLTAAFATAALAVASVARSNGFPLQFRGATLTLKKRVAAFVGDAHTVLVSDALPSIVYTRAVPRSGVHVTKGKPFDTVTLAANTEFTFVGTVPARYSCHVKYPSPSASASAAAS